MFLFIEKVDRRPKWRRALEAFKSAGAVYKAKHNKLSVIIYDNIGKIMNVDPEVLDALQNDAKMNADHRNYIAVFVSSEGSVPRRMECKYSHFFVLLRIVLLKVRVIF